MNLKEAARNLGVHYQTAYKWVRSGALTAVRVGSRYEVSQAAIDQFLATRRTLLYQADHVTEVRRRRTDLEPEDVLEELEAMVSDPVVTISALERFAARRGAYVLGDLCLVWIDRRDGSTTVPVYEHASAERAAFATALAGISGRLTSTGGIVSEAMRLGVTVRDEHLDQYELRRSFRPELRQYMDRFPVHSLVAAPIVVDDEPRGGVVFTRDDASRPYTADDECFAARMGRRIGALVRTADDTAAAWELRGGLAATMHEHLHHRAPGKPLTRSEVQDLLFGPGTPGAESSFPCVVVDPEGRLLGVNAVVANGVGQPADEIETTDLQLVFDEQHLEAEHELFQRVVSGDIDYHDFQAKRSCEDGTRAWIALHRVAVREDDATLTCVITVGRPIHTAPTISSLVGI